MKKLLLMLLALTMCVSMCACGGDKNKSDASASESTSENSNEESRISEPEVTYYYIGDTVSTDIVEFTLDDAAFAIALNNNSGDNYCTPKEYDAEEDYRNPYVANIGETLVFYEFTIKNLDRTTHIMALSSTVEYNDQQYDERDINKALYYHSNTSNKDPYVWYMDKVTESVALYAAETESHRAYTTIKTDVADLNDNFAITFSLSTSSGEKESFTYLINAN